MGKGQHYNYFERRNRRRNSNSTGSHLHSNMKKSRKSLQHLHAFESNLIKIWTSERSFHLDCSWVSGDLSWLVLQDTYSRYTRSQGNVRRGDLFDEMIRIEYV